MAEGVVSQVANGTLELNGLNGQQGFVRQDLINLLAEARRKYHKSPAYEIWVYRRSRFLPDDPRVIFPREVRGLGTMRLKQPAPLSNEGLQMSDLVVGFGYQEEAGPGVMFPITVANSRRIPTDENLVLHTEVYNLEPDEDNRCKLQLNYRVEPKKGFLGWLKNDDPLLQISLNLKSQTGQYMKNLQITTRKLEPGDYKLIFEAVDKSSGRRTEREFEFEVVE